MECAIPREISRPRKELLKRKGAKGLSIYSIIKKRRARRKRREGKKERRKGLEKVKES